MSKYHLFILNSDGYFKKERLVLSHKMNLIKMFFFPPVSTLHSFLIQFQGTITDLHHKTKQYDQPSIQAKTTPTTARYRHSSKEWSTPLHSPSSACASRRMDTPLRCLSTDGCISDHPLSDRCVVGMLLYQSQGHLVISEYLSKEEPCLFRLTDSRRQLPQ